jgi:DNA polymerase-1
MHKTKKGLLLAIDSNSLIHRAYHAYPPALVSSDGRPVNAVYGFTSMLLDILLKYKPEYVFCAFDTHKPTFRHTDYVGYKASRPKTDSELSSQFGIVEQVLQALNIPIFKVEGYEADDILGTITHFAATDRVSPVTHSYILTGDRDLFQLVDDKIHVILPKGSFKNLQEYSTQQVIDSMGVPPERITDLKGLMGDASDSIPGVKGVGPKTACDLITTYGSLEEIYKHIADIANKSKKLATVLQEEEEIAVLSKKLATITKEAPVTFTYEAALTHDFSMAAAMNIFTQLQFRSLLPKLKKFGDLTAQKQEDVPVATVTGSLEDDLAKHIDEYAQTDESFSMSGADILHRLERVPVSGEQSTISNWDLQQRITYLYELTQNAKKNKNGFVVIYQDEKLVKLDISRLDLSLFGGVPLLTFGMFHYFNNTPGGIQGSKIAAENLPKINALINDFCLIDVEGLSYSINTGRTDYSLVEQFMQYSIDPNVFNPRYTKAVLLRLFIEAKSVQKYETIERVASAWDAVTDIKNEMSTPLKLHQYLDKQTFFGVALMHLRGVLMSTIPIEKTGVDLEKEIQRIEREIFDDIGFEFNIRSPKQLGDILFGQLGLPAKKKTKTGYSTDDEVLQELMEAHPAIPKILQYRQITKLLGTYIKPFLELAATYNNEHSGEQFTLMAANPEDKKTEFRIHSQFNPLATPTGRLSSNNPNLQNLPIKTELGRSIRKFFVPEKDHVIISLDYSQIDLRVMAHIADDEGLIEAFTNNRDIHRSTAAKVFGVAYEEVDDAQRRMAKTVNFGLLYGMSSFGLSRSLGISVKEAAEFINSYFANFPKVKDYMDEIERFGKEKGYVVSLLGRRRFIYGIDSHIRQRQQAAFREAINMPIQGGTDDIMRLSLGRISMLPEVLSGQVRLILQVHDALVFEVPNNEEMVQQTAEKIKDIMENVIKLKVPLKVEYKIGDSL